MLKSLFVLEKKIVKVYNEEYLNFFAQMFCFEGIHIYWEIESHEK